MVFLLYDLSDFCDTCTQAFTTKLCSGSGFYSSSYGLYTEPSITNRTVTNGIVCNLWIVMDREPDELLRHSGLQSTWILAHLFSLPCHFHLYCVLVWHIWNSPPHTCLSFCLFCVLWLIIFSHRLFLHQVSANFIKSGEFTLERMGVVYKAKAHLKSPFDPENKRVKGIYDWEQTTHVKTDEKHTSYRTAPEAEGFTTFCTSSCFCLLSNTSSSQMLLILFWFDGTHVRMIDFMLICKMLHVESWWKMCISKNQIWLDC